MRAVWVAVVASAALTGCAQGPSEGDFLKALLSPAPGATDPDAPSALPDPLAQATLARGDVIVAGPSGYCVDPTSIGTRTALIASCRILSGGKSGADVSPMIVSVTAGPRAAADALPTAEFMAQFAGAQLIDQVDRDGLRLAHLDTGGETALPEGDSRYWRGAFFLGTRVVGLALYAPAGSALAGDRGAAMLQRVRDRIVELSPKGDTQASVAGGPAGNGILSRLFQR